MTPPETDSRHVLADFQLDAVVALTGVIRRAISQQVREPSRRDDIARHGGVMLLQSPTGSGKTLMLGRTLEDLVGHLERKTVWFWFAPFAGLVNQTIDALAEQCPGLRLRDATRDREPGLTRDGDVFVHTWGAVAANNQDARKVRRVTEDSYSLDQMLEMLRLDGFSIGVVIDEAHLNFGMGAQAAASFYLEHLKPDVTILATATPRDAALEAFARNSGVEVASRVEVSRQQVVQRGLNKFGLMLGVMRLREQDQGLVDPETAALSAGWYQHRRVKDRLTERDLGVVPLMLVQVEDQAQGGEDPIERVKEKLIALGVPESKIAIHTSGKPDPDFHTLAFDPSREVLIFKVAVATGFDAPRAWTLVSVRPSRGTDFGLQIVGRIMRVHPAVRPIHGEDTLLDRGYVFLTDPELQSGLQSAASALESVVASIDVVTNNFDLVELGTAQPLNVSDVARVRSVSAPLPPAPENDEDRQSRLDVLIDDGFIRSDIRDKATDEIDRAIQAAEQLKNTSRWGDLFGGTLPRQDAPDLIDPPLRSKPLHDHKYHLRPDLGVPEALVAEVPPSADILNSEDFNRSLAREFIAQSQVLGRVNASMGVGRLEFEDLFDDQLHDTVEDIQVRLDDNLIVERGQRAFNFDASIDDRELRRFMKDELRKKVVDAGIPFNEHDLTRAIFLAAMREPNVLREAQKSAKAQYVTTALGEEIPKVHYDLEGCAPSRLSAYGVIPSDLNSWEVAFAKWLDSDETGRVRWWLRNPSRSGYTKGWSTCLIRPSGGFFFPDFVVSVRGRATPNEIVLCEIKGDHLLNENDSLEKIQVTHRTYQSVRWAKYDKRNQQIMRLAYEPTSNRILEQDRLSVDALVLTSG